MAIPDIPVCFYDQPESSRHEWWAVAVEGATYAVAVCQRCRLEAPRRQWNPQPYRTPSHCWCLQKRDASVHRADSRGLEIPADPDEGTEAHTIPRHTYMVAVNGLVESRS